MRKIKFLKITVLALVLAAPLFLTGCKAKCPKPEANIPGTSTYRQDCPVVDASTANGKPKELNFYFVYDNTDAFQEQIQAFTSKMPGLVVHTKKFTNLQEYEDLIVNEIAQGEGPDVFMVQNSWIPKHYKKLLPMPLDLPYVMTPDLFRQTYFQAAADDLIVDEKIVGMPLGVDNLAIYYNKAIFKDQLATTDNPGQLWEDIKNQVFELTKRNNGPERFALSGMAMGRADNISSGVDILYGLMLEYGVKFYDDKEERATFADPAGASGSVASNPGIQAMTEYTSYALPSYKNYSWNDTITGFAPDEKEVNPFARGKVAMIVGYPYLYDAIVKSINDQQKLGTDHMDVKDIGIAPFPQLTSGDQTARRDTVASYFPLVVAHTTKYPKEAWTLVQFLTSAEALQTYHKKTHHPTSRKDMVEDQQTDPLFGAFAYQAPFAKSFKVYDAAKYQKVFSDAIQQVATNVATPDQAMHAAQEKITCLVKKAKDLVPPETDCKI